MAAVLAAGVAFFQVGRTADLRSRAQTAADAAALAGAQAIRAEHLAYLRGLGPVELDRVGLDLLDLLGLSERTAQAAAEDYAGRNGARVVSFERRGLDVVVGVETTEAVDGRDARRLGVEGTRGGARARARVSVTFLGLPSVTSQPSPPSSVGGPPGPIMIDPFPLFAFKVRLVPLGG